MSGYEYKSDLIIRFCRKCFYHDCLSQLFELACHETSSIHISNLNYENKKCQTWQTYFNSLMISLVTWQRSVRNGESGVSKGKKKENVLLDVIILFMYFLNKVFDGGVVATHCLFMFGWNMIFNVWERSEGRRQVFRKER